MPVICFRNLDDQRNRRGSEFCVGIGDELTELSKDQVAAFDYMVRDPEVPYSPKLWGSNPDGIGHFRVKAKFRPLEAMALPPVWLDEEEPYNGVVFQAEGPLPEEVDPMGGIEPSSLFYVPFLPEDNPMFDEAVFLRNIASLPIHVQRARRFGTWDSPEGARFPLASFETQGFDAKDLWHAGMPDHFAKHCSVDYGTRAPFAAIWWAVDYDKNVYVYREEYRAGMTATDQVRRIVERTADGERLESFLGDLAMFHKVANHTGVEDFYPSEEYRKAIEGDDRFRCGFEPAEKPHRVLRWALLDRYLARDNGFPDLFISRECVNLWREIQNAVHPKGTAAKDASEDIDERCPDHALDALTYGLWQHFGAAKSGRSRETAAKAQEEREHRDELKARRKALRDIERI